MCKPSSGCLENLSDYTLRVVPFCGGGRDLALQHESWKTLRLIFFFPPGSESPPRGPVFKFKTYWFRLTHKRKVPLPLSQSSPAVLSNGSKRCSLRGTSCVLSSGKNSVVFKGLKSYNRVTALFSTVRLDIRNSTALTVSSFRLLVYLITVKFKKEG